MIDSIDGKLLLDCMLLALKYYPLKTQHNENQTNTLNSSDISTNFGIDISSLTHSATNEDANNARYVISKIINLYRYRVFYTHFYEENLIHVAYN